MCECEGACVRGMCVWCVCGERCVCVCVCCVCVAFRACESVSVSV